MYMQAELIQVSRRIPKLSTVKISVQQISLKILHVSHQLSLIVYLVTSNTSLISILPKLLICKVWGVVGPHVVIDLNISYKV